MSEEAVYKTEEAGKLQARSSLPALLVIGIGVALLAANLLHLQLIELFWPGFVIMPGLLLLWPAYNATAERQSPFSFLAVFGAMTVTVGLLLLVMNLSNHFEAWAYSWTLVLASAAAGLMYVKRFDAASSVHEAGRKLIRLMAILFMGLAVFFEIIIFENFNPLLPLVLIGYGLYLLFRERSLTG
jgi:hypothetical protein